MRLLDKASPSFLRAQSAFSRAFDSVDAPANAAMLAGMILASELVLSNGREFPGETDLGKPVTTGHHEEVTIQPLTELDEHKSTTKPVAADNAEKQKTETVPEIAQNQNQDAHKSSDTAPASLPVKTTVEAADVPAPVKVAEIAPQQQAVVKDAEKETAATIETASVTSTTLTKVMQSAAESTPEKVVTQKAAETAAVTETTTTVIDSPKVISVNALDTITTKAGVSLQTAYDVVKMYALQNHFQEELGQNSDFQYVSGKLLIEEKGIANLDYHDIGIWTNTMADGSTVSVIAKASLIDDALTFFS